MTFSERLIAELEKVDPKVDEIADVPDDAEIYLKNILKHIAKTFAPSLQLKEGMLLGPRELGALLGHKVAAMKAFAGGVTVIPGPLPTPIAQGPLATAFEEMRDSFKKTESEFRGDYGNRVMRTMRRCVAIASQQPMEEMRQFFAGFNKALAFGTITREGKLAGATTATEFYWFLLLLGPELKKLVKSMAQLHELSRLFFKDRAGDIKTTEKRCKRIRLSFARL
jgi:hypothetical protein